MARTITNKDMFNYGRHKMRKCFRYMHENASEFYHGCLWPFDKAETPSQKGVEFEYKRTHWLIPVFKGIKDNIRSAEKRNGYGFKK